MIVKKVYISEILSYLGTKVIDTVNMQDGLFIDNLAESSRVNLTTLDWINPSKTDKQQIAEANPAWIILVDPTVESVPNKTLIVVENPKIALAEIGNHFFVDTPASSIHPTALIHSEANVGEGCTIGPYAVIGKATIGSKCVIEGHVHISDSVVMGEGCVIKAGSVLGGAGFGYERDEKGNKFRFPQIGQLIMGNYVEVGSNTCIDRGALSDTIIGDYTKINNLCHIAHNNRIGKNVSITGCVNISGSNIIEDDVWIAPNASIRGWIHIGRGAFIGMGAVVTKDVPAEETWVGNPAHKMEKK